MAVVVGFDAFDRVVDVQQFAQLLQQFGARRPLAPAADQRLFRVHQSTIDQPFAIAARIVRQLDGRPRFRAERLRDDIGVGQRR